MTKNIIAIGGGGFGRGIGSREIEKYILGQSEVRRPKICFIPTATGDNDQYKVNFYATFTKLNCIPVHLDLFKRTPDLKTLINAQDVIFVGGGNTMSMLGVWKQWGLDKILRQAYNKGTVMSGVIAGAICWFDKGITDSWKESQATLNCLGFVSGVCCPHYDEEPERIPYVKKILTENQVNEVYAIEGYAALHIIDDVPRYSISFKNDTHCHKVSKIDDSITHTSINGIIRIDL